MSESEYHVLKGEPDMSKVHHLPVGASRQVPVTDEDLQLKELPKG